MAEYIEKPDMQYVLHIKSNKKVEKRLIDYCLESVVDVFEDTGLTADVQPINQWISCKEKMPEEYKTVLVYEKDYGVMIGELEKKFFDTQYFIARKSGLILRTTEVKYWQPLPEPPETKKG